MNENYGFIYLIENGINARKQIRDFLYLIQILGETGVVDKTEHCLVAGPIDRPWHGECLRGRYVVQGWYAWRRHQHLLLLQRSEDWHPGQRHRTGRSFSVPVYSIVVV